MKICGIELKANNLILAVMQDDQYIETKTKKITLENDEEQNGIRTFCNDLLVFLESEQIEKVIIKKRAKKGNFAGGAVTFKMEALVQLNPFCEVELISPQSISAYEKKNNTEFPDGLKKYQEQAFLSACCAA
jgi:hypothetical protein